MNTSREQDHPDALEAPEFSQPVAPGLLSRFLLWCACVDYRLVPGMLYGAMLIRYSVVGALVVTSSLFAFLACLSFITYFQIGDKLPFYWLVLFSAFWGILIFSLERLILLSGANMGARNPLTYIALLLRVVIAVLLGLLLSEPLKLRMFSGDIEKRAQLEQTEKRMAYNTQQREEQALDPRYREILRLQSTRQYFENMRDCEANNAANQVAGTRQFVECLANIKPPAGLAMNEQATKSIFNDDERREAIRKNSAVAANGPLAARSRQLAEHWQQRLDKFDASAQEGGKLNYLLGQTQAEAAKGRAELEARISTMTPLESYGYLRQITLADPSARFLSGLLTLGFVLIDLIVLVAKLSFGKSVYDQRVESLERFMRELGQHLNRMAAQALQKETAVADSPTSRRLENLIEQATDDYTWAIRHAHRADQRRSRPAGRRWAYTMAAGAAAVLLVWTYPTWMAGLHLLQH